VNVVLDGAQWVVIKPSTLCRTFIFLDGRETKEITQQNANNTNVIMEQTTSYVDEAKRSSPDFISQLPGLIHSHRGAVTAGHP